MIVDTSALAAILRDEYDALQIAETIAEASPRRLSAASYVELGAVADSVRDPVVSRRLDKILGEAEMEIFPVTEEQARIARDASTGTSGGAAAIPPGGTSETVSPTRSQARWTSRSCSRAMASPTQM